MKSILVTGGLGYIGSHTVVQLIEHGYRPIIVDNLVNSDISILDRLEKLTGQKPLFYEMDVRETAELERILKTEKVDGVIHFAALKAVGESMGKPLEYYRNNIDGLLSLLEAMNGAEVNDLVFSSSCTVYGEPDYTPVDESAPFKPAESAYGHTKQVCEEIIRFTANSPKPLRAVNLRYFNPIGAHPSGQIGELPRGVPACLVPYLLQVAIGQRNELTVFGDDYDTPDGTCIRDYIHVLDLADAHIKSLEYLDEKQKPFLDVFNVGTGKGTSVLELIAAFEKSTGQKVPYVIGPRRAGDIVKSFAAADKANQLLNWQAQKSLEDALRDGWRWQQALSQDA